MSNSYQAIKYTPDTSQEVWDALTVEEALQININKEPYTVIMRSPGHEAELARGLLYTEDIYTAPEPVETEVLEKNDLGFITSINMAISETLLGDGYLSSRSLLSVSSCGICGKRELGDLNVKGEKIAGTYRISLELITQLFSRMEEGQKTFRSTGGSHAAAAFDGEGQLLVVMEDIGRHNAVDKVTGALLMEGKRAEAKVLTVSGRVSYEILTKAFRAQIPVLAAVSAPSTLAVDYAKELGITLIGFCRKGKATCYAYPHRIYDHSSKTPTP